VTTLASPGRFSRFGSDCNCSHGIRVNEQEHQIDLATALGKEVPDVTWPEVRA
jgi:hypothetical protein